MDYPRVLIVGAYFSEQSGSGTYLRQIFSAWPIDSLATICYDTLSLDWQRCHKHYRTGDKEYRPRKPFKQFLATVKSGPVSMSANSERVSTDSIHDISFISRMAKYAWRVLLRMLGGGEILYRVAPSDQLINWVHEFKPDVIYGHCSDLNSVRFLRSMQKALGLPIVLHIMDDWFATQYKQNLAARCLRPYYLAEVKKLVSSADTVLGICKEMAEDYEKRYSRELQWLPMPVDLSEYKVTARKQWDVGSPFRFRYGGRVGWAIQDCLNDLADAIHSLAQEGVNLSFDIVTTRTNDVPPKCLLFPEVNVQSPKPLSDLPRLQAEADVLVICFDFDTVSFRQARFSMPAKMAPCMASGTPVLVYGPAGLPVVEYARREGWGKVVDKRDPVALRAAMHELINSSELREQLGRAAIRLSTINHDAKVVSNCMQVILNKAAKHSQTNHKDSETRCDFV